MAVKLHRCSKAWLKTGREPCWKVEKALIDMGVEYEAVHGPWLRNKRKVVSANTGQSAYPAIEFEDGTWYREESSDMAATIRAGRLDAKRRSQA
jgi:hypothetical protein